MIPPNGSEPLKVGMTQFFVQPCQGGCAVNPPTGFPGRRVGVPSLRGSRPVVVLSVIFPALCRAVPLLHPLGLPLGGAGWRWRRGVAPSVALALAGLRFVGGLRSPRNYYTIRRRGGRSTQIFFRFF